MGKKGQSNESCRKADAVLQILRKQSPLSVKQEKFCNNACVERFLKAKGDNVKKAAKSLRACLTWRDSICTDHLIADEFSAELAEGVAYVAGHDEDSRPLLVFRIKQDYQKFHSQKMFTRLLVFTLEVAVGTMTKDADQLVILLDASFFRSASTFMNLLLTTLKTVSDYYPGRLHKAFVVDPPSFFSCLWKGVRPFVDLATTTFIISSVDFDDALLDFDGFATFPRAESLRFDSGTTNARIGACSSSRFAFTVSTNFDALKPWYLSLTLSDASATGSKHGPEEGPSPSLLGQAQISHLNARSLSFASPTARAPRGFNGYSYAKPVMKRDMFCTSTPLPAKSESMCDPRKPVLQPRTPKPSFLPSPGLFFRKDRDQSSHVAASTRSEKSKEAFGPYLKLYRRPYDEMIYRSNMLPPLGGLISLVPPHLKRRHASVSQSY